jgi:hypothetical protein
MLALGKVTPLPRRPCGPTLPSAARGARRPAIGTKRRCTRSNKEEEQRGERTDRERGPQTLDCRYAHVSADLKGILFQ